MKKRNYVWLNVHLIYIAIRLTLKRNVLLRALNNTIVIKKIILVWINVRKINLKRAKPAYQNVINITTKNIVKIHVGIN